MKSKATIAAESLLKLKQKELIDFQRKHMDVLLGYQQLEKEVHNLEYQLHIISQNEKELAYSNEMGLFY